MLHLHCIVVQTTILSAVSAKNSMFRLRDALPKPSRTKHGDFYMSNLYSPLISPAFSKEDSKYAILRNRGTMRDLFLPY